jgi:hypothetical protein
MRTPKVGDRVAMPKHAVVFIVRRVDESKKTIDAMMVVDPARIERGISWESITLLDD